MKRIIPNNPLTSQMQAPKEKPVDPSTSEISVDRLIDDGLLILYREIRNLKMLSANGKLEPNDAKDLRDHVKLLFELQLRQNQILKNLTDEELKVKASEALNNVE